MKTKTTIASPEELRARFRAAKRMPQMLEIQDQVRIALRQVSDSMDSEDGAGDSDAELVALFGALKGLLDEISARIQRAAVIDEIERRAPGVPVLDGAGRDFQRECCQFSLFRAAAHHLGMRGVDAAREIEVIDELNKRAKEKGRAVGGDFLMPLDALRVPAMHLSEQQRSRLYETRQDPIGVNRPPGTTGGSIVGTYTDPNQYIDILRPAMVVRQAGARVITDMRENLRLPRLTKSGEPGWFLENDRIPMAEQRWDDLIMTPHHDGAIVEVTRQALQQSNPEVEALVRADLSLKLANDVDVTAIGGSGAGAVPRGLLHDPDVPTLGEHPLDYDIIVDLVGGLAGENALNGSLAFIGDASVMTASMKLKDQMGRPYGDLLWHGYPTYWTNLATFADDPKSPLVFGNWNDLIIGFWSELDIYVASVGDAFFKGGVYIRAAMTLDLCYRHPVSWNWLSMVPPPPPANGATHQPAPRPAAAASSPAPSTPAASRTARATHD
jgi:HK97 family phage major capsid protein